MRHPDEIAATLLGVPFGTLDERTQKVARHMAGRKHIARNLAQDGSATRGQRAADAVASFGGSWTFIALFSVTLIGWVGLNG